MTEVAALEIAGLRKTFGGVVALAGVDITVPLDQILGIVGPNGSGKTTLFNVVTGVYRPTAGRVVWQGEDITGRPSYEIARKGLVRTFQQAMSFKGLSVQENVRIAWEHRRAVRKSRSAQWASPQAILGFVGLAGHERDVAGSLPFGNLRRLGLAVALAADPMLLLLDEPGAGLNDRETAELAELIRRLPGMGIGVCLIDHDMTLMHALCSRLVVLDFGSKIAEGPTAEVLNDAKVVEVYLGSEL